MLKKKKDAEGQSGKVMWKTLGFMLKTAWQHRPSLIFVYLVRLVADVASKLSSIILPKFLLDEIVLFAGGAELSQHIRNAAFYAGLIVVINLAASVLNSISANCNTCR